MMGPCAGTRKCLPCPSLLNERESDEIANSVLVKDCVHTVARVETHVMFAHTLSSR